MCLFFVAWSRGRGKIIFLECCTCLNDVSLYKVFIKVENKTTEWKITQSGTGIR